MAAPPQHNQLAPPLPQTADPAHDEVRTIFVLGFPPDLKERELQNLLRWWPDYEASQMNFKCDQPMGFVLFSTASMALAARDALQSGVLRIDGPDLNTGLVASKRMCAGGDYSSAPFPGAYPPACSAQPMAVPPPAWGPRIYAQPHAQFDQYAAYPARNHLQWRHRAML